MRSCTARALPFALALVAAAAPAFAGPPKPKPTPTPTPTSVPIEAPQSDVYVAHVLLATAALPAPDAVLAQWPTIAPKGPALGVGPSADPKVTTTYTVGEAVAAVELVRAPVDTAELDNAAASSLHGFLKDWRPEAHTAQLVVTLRPDARRPKALANSDFLRLTAAVATASHAVAVYLETGLVASPTDFFVTGVTQEPPLIVSYTGLSRVYERDPKADAKAPPTRFGLLSHGMRGLDLPELYLTAPLAKASDGLEYFLDLLAYMVGRGKALPDGDMVGRSDDEKLKVHYEASPAGGKTQVWRVDLP